MNKRQIIFVLVSIFVFFSCENKTTKSNDDTVVYRQADDPELEQAKQDALANLNYFIHSFNLHSKDTTYYYAVKADFVENDEHEHMWVNVLSIDGNLFVGLLDNEPQVITKLKYGTAVQIAKDEIEDWLIQNSETEDFEGGYSIKVFDKQ